MATATQQISLSRATPPVKIGFGAMAMILVGLVYYVFLHTEVGTKIDGARRRKGELESALALSRQSQAGYFQDRDELVMRQQRQRELNKVLPAETEAAAFLSALQQVSNVSGVDLKGWKPEEEQSQAFYAKVPMRLDLGGHFHQIAKFMYEVGRLDRIINIKNIELSEPKVVGDDVDLKARCLATTFHALKAKPAPATSAAGAATAPPPTAGGGTTP